jgi:hypothetical protein
MRLVQFAVDTGTREASHHPEESNWIAAFAASVK